MKEIPSKDKKSYDRVYNSSHSFCFSFSKPAQMLCKVVRVIAEEVVKSLSLASPLPPPLPATQKKKERRRRKTEEECSGAVESCCGWTVPSNMLYCVTQKLQGYSSRGMSSNNLYREESSVEFKMVSKRSEKIMCSTQSVRSFPGVSEEVSPCD